MRSVDFHPDGTCVASGSVDSKVKLWDLRSKRLLQHYDAHDDTVNKISFHPNGTYLLTGSNDSTIKIWDVRMGTILFTLYGHEGAASAVSFSPCGDYFASGGDDAIVMTWKSNLVSGPQEPGDSDGLVTVAGGHLGSTMHSNKHTHLVSDRKSKAGISNFGGPFERAKSPGHTDMLSSHRFLDAEGRMPEEEFYRKPDMVETIPESALDKVNLQEVPSEICSTLTKVVNQLDIISTTLAVLEQRQDSNEEQTRKAIEFFESFRPKH